MKENSRDGGEIQKFALTTGADFDAAFSWVVKADIALQLLHPS